MGQFRNGNRLRLSALEGSAVHVLSPAESHMQAEQQEIIAELEDLVVSYDPATLRQEIVELGQLIAQALTELQSPQGTDSV